VIFTLSRHLIRQVFLFSVTSGRPGRSRSPPNPAAHSLQRRDIMVAALSSRDVLLVVRPTKERDDGPALQGDDAIRRRLEELGYRVQVTTDGSVGAGQVKDKALVIVSSLRGSSNLDEVLGPKQTVPAVIADSGTLAALGMVGEGQHGVTDAPPTHLHFGLPSHSLSAGCAGTVEVSTLVSAPVGMLWGEPAESAIKIASVKREARRGRRDVPQQAVVFAYERGALMARGIAPARRVGFFIGNEAAARLTNEGWALFDAAVRWALGVELKQFGEVFREEWQEVRERRARQRIDTERIDLDRPAPSNPGPPDNSGGGIRSATFCLGLIQGMRSNRVLRLFDYVSTVSGGGYFGGWWSAWLSRAGFNSEGDPAYPCFNVTEVRSARKIVEALLDTCRLPEKCEGHRRHNLLAFYCQERVPKDSVRLWAKFHDDGRMPEDVKENVVKELNELIEGGCLYDAALKETCALAYYAAQKDVCYKTLIGAPAPGEAARPDFNLRRYRRLRAMLPGWQRLRPLPPPLHGDPRLSKFFDGTDAQGRPRLSADTKHLLDAYRKWQQQPGVERATAGRSMAPGSYDLKRLNRMLIEDAFPSEIGSDYFPPLEKIEPERTAQFFDDEEWRVRGAGNGSAPSQRERTEHSESWPARAPTPSTTCGSSPTT
jgi:hypothetical protein